MAKLNDRTGQRVGRLVVVTQLASRGPDRETFWRCLCDCGRSTDVAAKCLRTARIRSCGCLRDETTRARSFKHGQSRVQTPEYIAWQHAKRRCLTPTDPFFADYGGRGITICPEWSHDFMAFLNDMGPRPSGLHSLDRIDVNGPYEPGNCRWTTAVVQANNKKTYNRSITVHGKTLTVAQAATHYDLPYDRLIKRLNRGWPPEKAVQA